MTGMATAPIIFRLICAFAPFLAVRGQTVPDHPADVAALRDLFVATGGAASSGSNATWRNTENWLVPGMSMCSWYGISCAVFFTDPSNASGSSFQRVTSVDMSGNGLDGTLPPSIGNLQEVQSLYFYFNTLAGSIPDSIGSLRQLQYLELSATRLSGTIPRTLGGLGQLLELDLSETGLTGTIPPELGNCSLLESLRAMQTHIAGTLPAALSQLSRLRLMDFTFASFVGTLPDAFGNLSSLQKLRISNTKIVGTIPASFARLTNLVILELYSNRLNGTLPDIFRLMKKLQILQLFENRLEGLLPESIGHLPLLTNLRLQSNRFIGVLPDSYGSLSNVAYFYVHKNQINGSLPTSLANLTKLVELDLSANLFTGTIPSFGALAPTELTFLSLSTNRLEGTIPRSLGNLLKLRELGLSGNRLVGSIPDELGKLKAIERLYLHENQLNSTISPSFGRFVSMQILDLSSNQLGGSLPTTLGNLTALIQLRLFSNVLEGTIPGSFRWLVSLQELILHTNRLEGFVPDALSQLTNLKFLDLHGNSLSGPIPLSLRQLQNLTVLDLSLNNFGGDFDLLTAAFFPGVVNVSFNSLGPRLAAYPAGLDSSTRFAIMDIRSAPDAAITYSCPYPDEYPPSTVVLRSACRQPWALLGRDFGVFLASMSALILILWLLVRLTSATIIQIRYFIWIFASVATVASLVFDITTLLAIFERVYRSVDNCIVINRASVFLPFMPNRRLIETEVFRTSSVTLFSQWLNDYLIDYRIFRLDFTDVGVRQNMAAFSALCRRLSECDVDALGTTCVQLYPERTDSNGEAHRLFRVLVIVVAAVFLVVELVRFVCVALSLWYGQLVGGFIGIELSMSSFAAPLLYASKPLRGPLLHYILYPSSTANDIICRLIHTVLLCKAPLLAVNLYFLLSVTQVGMGPLNWLGLITNALKIVQLLAQAVAECRKAPLRPSSSATSSVDIELFSLDGLSTDAVAASSVMVAATSSGGNSVGAAPAANVSDLVGILARAHT
jgi:Leucine-rich repeat (LRR) protein